MNPVDSTLFREAMSRFASGVTVVTSVRDGKRVGMTASSFVSVSADPPLILVCIAQNLHTHAAIGHSGAFAANILGIHQIEVGQRFAGLVPENADRFADLSWTSGVTGTPLLDDSIASIECRLQASHAGGDHTIFVGAVVNTRVSSDQPALLYHNRLWQRAVAL